MKFVLLFVCVDKMLVEGGLFLLCWVGWLDGDEVGWVWGLIFVIYNCWVRLFVSW